MKEIYVVKYYGGSYDDYYSNDIFVTTKKSVATKYVARFNSILKKWKKYYSQFESKEDGFKWIKDEFVEQHFGRWNKLQSITKCYISKIEIR